MYDGVVVKPALSLMVCTSSNGVAPTAVPKRKLHSALVIYISPKRTTGIFFAYNFHFPLRHAPLPSKNNFTLSSFGSYRSICFCSTSTSPDLPPYVAIDQNKLKSLEPSCSFTCTAKMSSLEFSSLLNAPAYFDVSEYSPLSITVFA